MGYFTWTDARCSNPPLNRDGFFNRRYVVEYDKFAKVVCPDGTEYATPSYNGYGIFDGHDVYELVADWNRSSLPMIFNAIKDIFGVMEIAVAYASGDECALKGAIAAAVKRYPFLEKEWKRNIGISIACENNDIIPFPIKITTERKKSDYNALYPSISTQ